jgi:hypothetical protein
VTDPSLPSNSSMLPSPSNRSHGLGDQINTSSRSAHALLNRLIKARLPLALPPYEATPLTYTTGLLHIAPLYFTFEAVWKAVLDISEPSSILEATQGLHSWGPGSPTTCISPSLISSTTGESPTVHYCKAKTRVQSFLAHVWLPSLLRTKRLREDIRYLSDISEDQLDRKIAEISGRGKIAKVSYFHSLVLASSGIFVTDIY